MKVVIQNKNKIIKEIFEMKARIVMLEEGNIKHYNTDDKLLENLKNQRDVVQTKLEKVEQSIRAIDEMLKIALSENEDLKRKECTLTQSKTFIMKKHFETKHDEQLTKACNVCDQTFEENHELEAHLKTHTGVETFPCDICGKGFFLKWRLKKHIGGHYRKRHCHFFNNGKACPFQDIGCKFQHQVSPICKFQRCKIALCQYRHNATNVTVETVEVNDKTESAIDIDKFCDEKCSTYEDYEEEDLLSDSFIDKIMKDGEIKLKSVSTVKDDYDVV